MKRKVLLHIGLHKTGTTAVQVFLSANSARLPGLLYPSAGRPPEHPYGHHMLPWSLQRRIEVSADALWGQLRAEIEASDAREIVLSAEAFGMLGARGVARVREYLAPLPVQVIVYLRRQDEFVQAMYATMVLSGGAAPRFEDFVKRATGRGRFDYHGLLEKWASVFGKENVRARVYAKNRMIDGDVVKDFCDQAGIALSGELVFPAENVNRGVPLNVLEIIRLMRSLQLPAAWIEDVRRIAEKLYPVHRFYDIMSPDAARSLLDGCRAGNDRVAREFLNGAPGTGLFEETFDYMSNEQWNELYGGPYGFVKKTIDDLRGRFVAEPAAREGGSR